MPGWEKNWIPACPLGKTMCFNVLQCYFCPGPLLICLSWRFSYKLNFLPGTLPIIGQRRFIKEIFTHIIFFEHFSLFLYPSLRLFILDTFLSMILWWLLSYACILLSFIGCFFNKVLFHYLFIYCICKAPRGEDNLVLFIYLLDHLILQIWPIKVPLIDISG